MSPVRPREALPPTFSRRRMLQLGAAVTAATLLPRSTPVAARSMAQSPPIDPYSGAIPLAFPVRAGTYQAPVLDNWHQNRAGEAYPWSHEQSATQRAHDGVDTFPRSARSLPTVYAPFTARVAAVNLTRPKAVYRVSGDATILPPWDYSVSRIYGNFIWLCSTEASSAGYYMFYCHLQNETILRQLADRLARGEDVAVDTTTAVGVMGDSGNAGGHPQLHLELHYPRGVTFTCTKCGPAPRAGMTALNPSASLAEP